MKQTPKENITKEGILIGFDKMSDKEYIQRLGGTTITVKLSQKKRGRPKKNFNKNILIEVPNTEVGTIVDTMNKKFLGLNLPIKAIASQTSLEANTDTLKKE